MFVVFVDDVSDDDDDDVFIISVRLCLSNAVTVEISCGNSDFRRNNCSLFLPIDLLAFKNLKNKINNSDLRVFLSINKYK